MISWIEHAVTNTHYKMVNPVVDGQFTLVLGLPVGAWPATRGAH